MASINVDEKERFKEAAKHVMALTDKRWRAMSKKFRSDAMAAIHETMEALRDVEAIDKQTMRGFDEACLTPIRPLKPEEIKAIREKEHVSQTVFANYLNVTSSLVSKWERGEKRPSGASLKLLSPVAKRGLDAVA